jgi:hypothetical protein
MIISDALYESIADDWDKMMDEYFSQVDALSHPRNQKMYNDVHAAHVIRRDAFFSSFGITDEDFIDTCSDRIERKENTHPQTEAYSQLADLRRSQQ